jgi:hypothetical protein
VPSYPLSARLERSSLAPEESGVRSSAVTPTRVCERQRLQPFDLPVYVDKGWLTGTGRRGRPQRESAACRSANGTDIRQLLPRARRRCHNVVTRRIRRAVTLNLPLGKRRNLEQQVLRLGEGTQRPNALSGRRDSGGQVPAGVPHPAHDALTSTRITAIGRLRNARQTGCSRRHHATGPLRSSRWGAMKPTDQNQPLSKHKSRLRETHVFL